MSLNTENSDETQGQQASSPAAATTPRMYIKTKSPRMADITSTHFKRQSSFTGSPPSHKGLGMPSTARCLCSPTTHVGSFRCRHHRSSLGISRAASVGSNLSLLGAAAATAKPGHVGDASTE